MTLKLENDTLFTICHCWCKPGETAVEPVQRSEMSVEWEFPTIRGFPGRWTETQLLLTCSDRHIISNTSHPTLHVQGKKIGNHEQEMRLLPHWPFTAFQWEGFALSFPAAAGRKISHSKPNPKHNHRLLFKNLQPGTQNLQFLKPRNPFMAALGVRSSRRWC